jgi:radical SAM-linked protein
MMKAFQRGVRRAGLMAEYSQGFNPQMQMVFGAPLSLGFTSEAEFADFTFLENYEPGFVMEQLNKHKYYGGY